MLPDKEAELRDIALRTLILRWLADRGWSRVELARRAGVRRDRFHRALQEHEEGSNRLSPKTLALIAGAFGTTVIAMEAEAGLLDPGYADTLEQRKRTFADYVANDPWLSETAKAALIAMYQTAVRAPSTSSEEE